MPASFKIDPKLLAIFGFLLVFLISPGHAAAGSCPPTASLTSPALVAYCGDHASSAPGSLGYIRSGILANQEALRLEQALPADQQDKNLINDLQSGLDSSKAGAQTLLNERQTPTTQTPPSQYGKCWLGFYDGIDFPQCGLNVTIWLVNITGSLLGLMGQVFDAGITYSILKTNVFLGTSGGSTAAIQSAWVLARDISNIAFIFVLLYIAIQVTFASADAPKMIAGVVITALLINFSGFFTRVAIDAGNELAYVFYNKIHTATVSGNFVSALKIQDAIDQAKPTSETASGATAIAPLIMRNIGVVILILITCAVLIIASIMFFRRLLILIFLYMIAPLAFVSRIVPGYQGSYKKWWDTLISTVFFAPAMLFLIWAVLAIAPTMGSVVGNGGSIISIMISFVILCGLMIGSVIMGEKMSEAGSKALTGWAKNVQQRVVGAGVAGGASALRNTVGRFAGSRTNSESLKELASQKGIRGTMARLELKASQKTAGASFDVRNTKMGEKIVDAGKGGGKGGFDAKFKDQLKERKAFSDSLKQSAEAAEKTDAEKKFTKQIVGTQAQKDSAKTTYDRVLSDINRQNNVIKNNTSLTDADRTAQLNALNTQKEKAKSDHDKAVASAEATEKAIDERYNYNKQRQQSYSTALATGTVKKYFRVNREAAASIRKELNKGKDKELLDKIKEWTKDDKPEEKTTTPEPTAPTPTPPPTPPTS